MTIAMALGLALSPALALQSVTLHGGPEFGENGLATAYDNGVCRVTVKGKDADGERILAGFSRRLRDGNLSVSLEGPFMQTFRGADTNVNHPVTVVFDAGRSSPSRSGGYDLGGFSEYVWGGWGPGAASDQTYAALRGIGSFSVEMDGNTYGPFTWTGSGALWTALDDCEADNS